MDAWRSYVTIQHYYTHVHGDLCLQILKHTNAWSNLSHAKV